MYNTYTLKSANTHWGLYAQGRGHSGFILLGLYKLHRSGTNQTAFQIRLLSSLIKLGWDYIYGTHSDFSLSSLSYAHHEEQILVKRRKQCKIVYALMKTVFFTIGCLNQLGLGGWDYLILASRSMSWLTWLKWRLCEDLQQSSTVTIFEFESFWILPSKCLSVPQTETTFMVNVSLWSPHRADKRPAHFKGQRWGIQLQQINYTVSHKKDDQRVFCNLCKRLKSNS